ncbi:MAG: hypothetical protein AABX16_05705 [Nanoarchaeota archaeon]
MGLLKKLNALFTSNTKKVSVIIQLMPDSELYREVYTFSADGKTYYNSEIHRLSKEERAFYSQEKPDRYLVQHKWRDPSYIEAIQK